MALVAGQFLPQLAAGFLRNNSRIDLNLLPMYQAAIQENLDSGNIDLAFTRQYDMEPPDYVCKKVYADNFCIVMRRDHPLANQPVVSFEMLADQPFVTYREEVSPALLRKIKGFCARAGFVPNIVKQTTRIESLLFLIEAGIGIAVLNRGVEQVYNNHSLAFIDVQSEEDTRNDLILAWRADNQNHCIPVFVRYFESVYNELFVRP